MFEQIPENRAVAAAWLLQVRRAEANYVHRSKGRRRLLEVIALIRRIGEKLARWRLAFGTGIHVCLGAMLARVETAIALEGLFARHPNLRLAVPRSQIRNTKHFGTRALVSLPVVW